MSITIEGARQKLTGASIRFTRSEYMSGVCSHEEYYSQFVSDGLVKFVSGIIGNSPIESIQLNQWDRMADSMAPSYYWNLALSNMFTQNNEAAVPSISLSDKVCLLKCAAKIPT